MTNVGVITVWIGLAAYGIVVQILNTRWLLYVMKTINNLPAKTEQQVVAVSAHLRVNVLRTFVVWGNLGIGVLIALVPPRPPFLEHLILHYQGTITAILTIVFPAVFILNELGWDVIITLEIMGRRKIRRLERKS